MPDYMMCKGGGCMLKDKCLRFTAKGSDWQSWFAEVPWDTEELDCEYFMDNRKEKEEEIF